MGPKRNQECPKAVSNEFGKKLFFQKLFFQTCEGRCILQPAALKAPHWNLTVWCRTCARGGGDLFSTASGPVSTVLRCSGGSILVLVRDLALYAALLCCCGPRPHDPRRCGLNSCPSHTPMTCQICSTKDMENGIKSPSLRMGRGSAQQHLNPPPLQVVDLSSCAGVRRASIPLERGWPEGALFCPLMQSRKKIEKQMKKNEKTIQPRNIF